VVEGEARPAALEEAVRWAVGALRRTRWPEARLRAAFCDRGPRDLLAEGETSYTTPCADLSTLAAHALQDRGLAPTLVLGGIRRPLTHVKFQCGLEVEVEGTTWVVGFAISSTYLYPGRFVETKRRPWVVRVRPDAVDPDRPFLRYFDDAGPAGVHRRIPGYELERDLAWHARRQGWLRYVLARRSARSAGRARRRGRLGAVGLWE
jgi:hypothetical protein